MSSPNLLPSIRDDAQDQMSEVPRETTGRSFDFKDFLKSSLEEHASPEQRAAPEDGGPSELTKQLNDLNGDKEDFLRTLRSVTEVYGKKRLFVCCDGTWLNASGTVAPLSNVAKLARSVNRDGDDPLGFKTVGGVPQLVYYSSGVGTRSSLGMDSSVAAVTGKGISHVIRDAYCFLSNNYNGVSNRDEIILVGFSRGAFTVRCLAEFISHVGLLRRNSLPFLPVFFEDWVKGDEQSLQERKDGTEVEDGLFYRDPTIKVLAEWDPVDTLGVPYFHESGLQRCMERQIVPRQVEHAFLALSLGEKRSSYWPTVWKKKWTDSETTEVSQCAFLGDHGDVGGGHPDPGLSTISLLWMVSKIQSVCKADFQMYTLLQFNTPVPDPSFGLVPFRKKRVIVQNLANAKGVIHGPSLWWVLGNCLTFGGLFSGRRGSIIHELAANDEATGCKLEVHQTVRLLVKQRINVRTGPLNDKPVLEEQNNRYKWTLKGNPQISIYEQPLYDREEKLFKRWTVQAKAWQKGSKFQLSKDDEEYINHNWRNTWKGVIKNKAWGFKEGGEFGHSLINQVYVDPECKLASIPEPER